MLHRAFALEALERDAAVGELAEDALLPLARVTGELVTEPDARRERLHDLEIGAHVGRRRDDWLRDPDVVVAVRAEDVVVLEKRGRRQHDSRARGRVSEERIDDDDEL